MQILTLEIQWYNIYVYIKLSIFTIFYRLVCHHFIHHLIDLHR